MRDRGNIDARQGPGGNAGSIEGGLSVSAPSSAAQVIQKLFGRREIRGAETLGKAVVDRLKACDGIGRSTLTSQQAGEACSSAEFPGQSTLPARTFECLPEKLFGGFSGPRRPPRQ